MAEGQENTSSVPNEVPKPPPVPGSGDDDNGENGDRISANPLVSMNR